MDDDVVLDLNVGEGSDQEVGDAIMDVLSGDHDPTPAPDPDPTEEGQDKPTEKDETSEENKTEESEESKDAPKDDDEASQDDTPEEVTVETLDELAEASGWEKEDLYNLKVPLGEGAEPKSVKEIMEDMGRINEEYQEFTQAREANIQYAQQQQEFINSFQQDSVVAAQVLDTMESNLDAMMNNPDMVALKDSDPGKFAQEALKIREYKEQLTAQRNELSEHYDNTLNAVRQNMIQIEGNKLQRAWGKDYSDNFVQAAEVLSSIGFNQQEINNMLDSRWILAAKELHDLRQQVNNTETQAKANEQAKQKLKTLPKKVSFRLPGGKPKRGGGRASDDNVVTFKNQHDKFVKSEGTDEKAFEQALDAILQ